MEVLAADASVPCTKKSRYGPRRRVAMVDSDAVELVSLVDDDPFVQLDDSLTEDAIVAALSEEYIARYRRDHPSHGGSRKRKVVDGVPMPLTSPQDIRVQLPSPAAPPRVPEPATVPAAQAQAPPRHRHCDHEIPAPPGSFSKKVPAEVRKRLLTGFMKLRGLMYADDLAIFADSRKDAEKAFQRVLLWCNRNGMRLNLSKCGYMHVLGQGGNCKDKSDLTVTFARKSFAIPYVTQYKYLGLTVRRDLSFTDMIAERRVAAEKATQALMPLFVKRSTPLAVKLTVLSSVIVPILLYGCEIWAVASANALEPIIVGYNNALRAALHLPVNVHIGLLRYIVGLDSVHQLIARRVVKAWRRWSDSSFPICDLMKYDLEFHTPGHGIFFDMMWSFIAGLHKAGVSVPIRPSTSVYSSILGAANYRYQMATFEQYKHSKELLARGYAPPNCASVISRLCSNEFTAVNEWIRILSGSWHGCADYASWKKSTIDKRYANECPFCNTIGTGETLEHYLLECSAWSHLRSSVLFSSLSSFSSSSSSPSVSDDNPGVPLSAAMSAGDITEVGTACTSCSRVPVSLLPSGTGIPAKPIKTWLFLTVMLGRVQAFLVLRIRWNGST